jgi:uncharacterized membrane protein (DUF4010 family)
MAPAEISLPTIAWPYAQVLMRLTLGLALGFLIGLERERAGKEAGVRTFAFICLMGTIGGALGTAYGLATLALVALLVVILNVFSLRHNNGVELTTSAAMMVTAMAGILCGLGLTIAPAAVMVIATGLLAWKERLAGLSHKEIRSGVLLAILAIVIYPALPKGAIGPWDLFEPRTAWIAVILIAGIGFFNYVLWKLYGNRGTELSGFFGGLINSNITVIEMVERVREIGVNYVGTAYRGIMLATSAMTVRNALLLLILAPTTLAGAFAPYALMIGASVVLVFLSRRQVWHGSDENHGINLEMPFSLAQALKYGLIFLALHVMGAVTQRFLGDAGFYAVSIIGGLLSSASAVAAAAALTAQGSINPVTGGTGAVLASFTSMLFSLIFVLRSRNGALVRQVLWSMLGIILVGALGLLLNTLATPWVERLLAQITQAATSV